MAWQKCFYLDMALPLVDLNKPAPFLWCVNPYQRGFVVSVQYDDEVCDG